MRQFRNGSAPKWIWRRRSRGTHIILPGARRISPSKQNRQTVLPAPIKAEVPLGHAAVPAHDGILWFPPNTDSQIPEEITKMLNDRHGICIIKRQSVNQPYSSPGERQSKPNALNFMVTGKFWVVGCRLPSMSNELEVWALSLIAASG